MRLFHYIEIENFKTFGGKQRIELDHPAVIYGPNNSGKTSAIQAIALWGQAVKHGTPSAAHRMRASVPAHPSIGSVSKACPSSAPASFGTEPRFVPATRISHSSSPSESSSKASGTCFHAIPQSR